MVFFSHTLGKRVIQVHPSLGEVAGFIAACAGAYGIVKTIPLVEAFVSSRLDLARKMHEMANELTLLHEELAEVKVHFGIAIVYIGNLVMHLRSGGKHDTMPPIPDELQGVMGEHA